MTAHEALVQALQIRLARLQRQRLGGSSEKIDHEIEQLELAPFEALEAAVSSAGDPIPTATKAPGRRRRKPRVAAETPCDRIAFYPGEGCTGWRGAAPALREDHPR